MGTWTAAAHWLPLSLSSPDGGRKSTPSAPRSPRAPPTWDGKPDDTARVRPASCRTGARSTVSVVAAVHGRKRTTRCVAYLQRRIISMQTSRSAARARPDMSTNRLAHRKHHLARPAASIWLGGIQCRLGAHTGDAADQCTFCRPTVWSQATAIGRRQSPLPCRCRASVGTAIWQWPEEQEVHPCLGTTCQLILIPPVRRDFIECRTISGHSCR